jgi:NAD-dependent dihydropyrimidine dehydrogenase PreA subunit
MTDTKQKKEIPRKDIPWNPTIDEAKCTGCGTCAEFCHHSVYELEGDKAKVVRPTDCVVGCTGCQSKCPEGAISFPDMKEFVETMRRLRGQSCACRR